MVTKPRVFSLEELQRMEPAEIQAAVLAAQNPAAPIKEKDPTSLGDVIRKTDMSGAAYTMPQNAQVLKEGGYVPVWNLQTGLPTIVLRNLLPMKVSETNQMGQRVFSVNPRDVPEGLPRLPQYPCMLHGDHEMRPLADKLGFFTCTKMLKTLYDVRTHTKTRHTAAWNSFEADKLDNEKTDEREWRKTSMAGMTAAAMASKPVDQIEKACVGCGVSFFALNEETVDVKIAVHLRACEPFIATFGQPESLTPISDFVAGIAVKPFIEEVTDFIQDAPTGQYNQFFQHCENSVCGYSCDGKTKAGAMNRMRAHVKREHPDA